ncbi:hypothetical protein [Niveispirillum sp. BGYR6]|uniref:hypothetical protein n=1 Tax=Niveispirillum sp. BGYR6 TaxID=2971249 RepID=UPI0022B96401|nr:hypothetical protein [Niveispirillum sp. BGYR6]MDG5494849.1 hypothetical protein [Niveispirillum sp. BGYR6]
MAISASPLIMGGGFLQQIIHLFHAATHKGQIGQPLAGIPLPEQIIGLGKKLQRGVTMLCRQIKLGHQSA